MVLLELPTGPWEAGRASPSIPASPRLKTFTHLHEGQVETVDGVYASVGLVVEEVVMNDSLLVFVVTPGPLGEDHVVDPLEGGASTSGSAGHWR